MEYENKDELIQAQNELIGILFEIIKRMQANNDLDEEYLRIVSNEQKRGSEKEYIDKILAKRRENSLIISRLLEKIQM